MKKEIRVDTPPTPLGTLEVVSVSESVSDSMRSKFYWGPRPRRPFWGLLLTILDFAGGTALQRYARCLMRPCRACSLRFSFFQALSNGSQFLWKWNIFKTQKACFHSYNDYL